MDGKAGRRPGRPETRAQIVEAARVLFAERGFGGTSIRAIATAAGVDPALVYHYFDGKEGLFRAALEIPIDPAVILARITADGEGDLPRRLVETFLSVWEHPETGLAMVGLARRVMGQDDASALVRGFLNDSLLAAAATALLPGVGSEEARTRITLVFSQMIGAALLRWVVRIDPLASMPLAALADVLTPTITRYLHGPLADLPESRTS